MLEEAVLARLSPRDDLKLRKYGSQGAAKSLVFIYKGSVCIYYMSVSLYTCDSVYIGLGMQPL